MTHETPYESLPAGVLRRIKVSGAWVHGKDHRPYYVSMADDPSQWALYQDVTILGPSRMCCEGRRAWLETEGELHVR